MTSYNIDPLGTTRDGQGLDLHAYKDHTDMQLLHPDSGSSAYLFRVPTNPGDDAFNLHQGSKLDPVVAAIRYDDYFHGQITLGDPRTGPTWGPWEQPSTRGYTTFAVKTTQGEQKYRWVRTNHSKRTGIVKMSGYTVWVLKDLTDVPGRDIGGKIVISPDAGVDVATLSLEEDLGERKTLKDKFLKRGPDDTAEDTKRGRLLFEKELRPEAQAAALVLVLALCHRDRCLIEKQRLGPCIDIKVPNGKHMAGIVGSVIGGGAIFAAGGAFGGPTMGGGGLSAGFSGGVGGGDCGGGGGGGGGGC